MKVTDSTTDVCVVLTSFPDAATAEAVVINLVQAKLCACSTMLPGAISIYEWNGSLERSSEVVVLFKTSASCVTFLQQQLTALHPYELPEVLVLPVTDGSDNYMQWVRTQCLKPTGHESDSSDSAPMP